MQLITYRIRACLEAQNHAFDVAEQVNWYEGSIHEDACSKIGRKCQIHFALAASASPGGNGKRTEWILEMACEQATKSEEVAIMCKEVNTFIAHCLARAQLNTKLWTQVLPNCPKMEAEACTEEAEKAVMDSHAHGVAAQLAVARAHTQAQLEKLATRSALLLAAKAARFEEARRLERCAQRRIVARERQKRAGVVVAFQACEGACQMAKEGAVDNADDCSMESLMALLTT